jgi:hypothetical protein
MKKLLNISVIAALAILPMAANADPVAGDPGATTANAAVATNPPKYGLAEADDTDANLATAGYVKGAYNAAIKAVNKLETTKQDALSSDQLTAISNVSGLTGRVGALETTVGDSDSGLVKAVADNATAIAGKQDSLNQAQLNAVNSGITADKVTGYDSVASAVNDASTGLATKAAASDVTALTTRVGTAEGKITTLETNAATYATKAGVLATINAATVPVMTTWGEATPTARTISVEAPANFVNQ